MSNPFSILLDESNDKVDKSCIILIRDFDEELGDAGFQNSNDNTTCELYSEITRLDKISAVNVLTHEAVLEASEIHLIDLDKAENLKIDMMRAQVLQDNPCTHEPEAFLLSCMVVYLTTLKY